MFEQHFTSNALGRHTRIEDGLEKHYLVAPMAMLQEGVYTGSGGPLFYEAAELERTAEAWNGKPIVVYHPTRNGVGVSANDPDILEKQGVGYVRNAHWSGRKLRAEAYLDLERLRATAPEIFHSLMNEDGVVEVSTGLFTDNEHSPGWHGGKNFEFVARNHRPDHLAILPKGKGACSVEDGCGLLQVNESRKERSMRNNNLPMPEWDFGYKETTLNHATKLGSSLPLPSMGYEASPVSNRATFYGSGLPLPSMGYEAAPSRRSPGLPLPSMGYEVPPILNGGGDRDDKLPLPKMDFGPVHNCVCEMVEYRDVDVCDNELRLPSTMPCGCHGPAPNSDAEDYYDDGLPLPKMTF